MEKNIVKNGTKVILFALGTEDTSVTGVITGHWSTMSGVLMYECHYKELDGTEGDLDNLQRRNFEIIPNKFINLTPHTITLNNGIHQVKLLVLRTNSATFAVVFPQCSMVRLRIFQNLKKARFISCQQWYQQLLKKKAEQMQQHQLQDILIALEKTDLSYPFQDS